MNIVDLGFLNQTNTIATFILESTDGLILFQTGPHSTFPKLKSEIEKLGHQVKDVKHVFLTHIHLDHAGAAWVFAKNGAKIYVHPLGAPHIIHPEKLMSSAKRIYKEKMDFLWGRMNPISETQVVVCEDNDEYKIGKFKIKGYHTPGHAIHHIAWQVDEKLIAGDVAGVRINQGIVVPPCPPPDINIEDWQKSIQIIRELDLKEIYLTHFGKITDINNHLNSLEERIVNWANWMKPHFESQKPFEEIIPEFSKMVAEELKGFGIDEKGIQQYETANPSFMAVAGLMRYWKKKMQ